MFAFISAHVHVQCIYEHNNFNNAHDMHIMMNTCTCIQLYWAYPLDCIAPIDSVHVHS